jgi:hypothetical protein
MRHFTSALPCAALKRSGLRLVGLALGRTFGLLDHGLNVLEDGKVHHHVAFQEKASWGAKTAIACRTPSARNTHRRPKPGLIGETTVKKMA